GRIAHRHQRRARKGRNLHARTAHCESDRGCQGSTLMSTRPPNRRILIIDDNPAIHEDFRKVLCNGNQSAAALNELEDSLFGNIPAPPTADVEYQIDFALQGEEGLAMLKQALADKRPYAMA